MQPEPFRTPVLSAAPQGTAERAATFELDTTLASVLHVLAGSRRPHELWHGPSAGKVYLAAVAMIYVPLFLCALISPLPVAARTATLRLPFLYDWNVAFTFLVSFPSLLVLTVTDQHVLASSLGRVQVDGILAIPEPAAIELSERWRQKFRRINIGAQLMGVLIGLVLSVFNYTSFRQAVGSWVASEGRLTLPVGLAFLFCIFLFYFLVSVYVLRSFATSLFLNDLVAHAQIRIQPFHPDASGGLRPVGNLGLRNQYGLTVCGLNLVLLVFVYANSLTVPPTLHGLMVAAAVAYIIVGPIVFLGPLLPFRAGMLRTRTELMSQIAQRLSTELERLRQQLAGGQITKEDEKLIDRIRKIGGVVDELPVWPFDTRTLRKFLTAYVVPLLGAFGVKPLLALAQKWLGI